MSTKAEDTQKNILDTARKHFLKDGSTGASLRNIVKKCRAYYWRILQILSDERGTF